MASIPSSSLRFPKRRSPERLSVLARAALAQAAGAALVLAIDWPTDASAALAAAVLAALSGRLLCLPSWWLPLNLALPLAFWGALALALDPAWYLLAAALLWLVFGFTARTSVPLYFSGRRELDALASIVPAGQLLDAGCGIGTALAGLHARRPGLELHGVEGALAPWLIARLRARGRWGARLGSLWREDFGRYDAVYAFLSPAPMARLWDKARAEMRPGTLLISNRFAVPGVPSAREIETGDGRRLYVWTM